MTTPAIPQNPSSVPAFYSVLQPPTTIDYTSKDWLGFVTSMLNYASIVMPEWDTSSEGDFGVMLVEAFGYMGDILSFYGDRLSQEAYLPTATQRLSILNLARLLGYVPTNGSPASGTVTFQTNNPGPAVTIPAGTQVATAFDTNADQPVIYQTTTTTTVAANGGTQTLNVVQGITYTQQSIGISDGTSGQDLQIPTPFVQDGTTSIFVESSAGTTQWTQVQFLVDYGPSDLVYSAVVDENNITHIQFGDNVNGAIPGIGLSIYATYTVGVGSAGNQAAGAVGVLVSDVPGVFVPFQSSTSTLYQSSAMTGGADPETNDQIRANAPQAYATQQRAVSTNDFAALALNIPGVLTANAVANHSTSVTLYCLGPNYQVPTSTLTANIQDYFVGKTLAGVTLTVGTPNLIPVDVGSIANNVQLQVLSNFNQGAVAANVQTAVQAVLSPPNTSFGMLLNVSSIFSAIMSVPGVQYVVIPVMTREDTVQTNTNPIQLRQSEVPVAGNFYVTTSGGIS